MRPVTRGGQGAYAPVVDVTSQPNLDNTLNAYPISFKGKANASVTLILGANPSAGQVLGALLKVAKSKYQPPAKKQNIGGAPTVAQISAIKKTLNKKLSNIYGMAVGELEPQLGRFCSYCELHQQNGVAVEHIAPKAGFPLFYIAWNNFLLACPICNSVKREQPERDNTMFNTAPADEVGYYDIILGDYLWPHEYFPQDVYRRTLPQLEYKDGANWKPVTYPVEPGTALTDRGETTRQVFADVYTDVTTKNKNKKVTAAQWLHAREVRVVVNPVDAQSIAIVDVTKLNRVVPAVKTKNGAVADIRLWTRTIVWFDALESLEDLAKANANGFDAMWRTTMKYVALSGMYSVWVRLLDLGGWVDPTTNNPMMGKFLAGVVEVFPGTDTANTP
jgi:hypothetical protein